MKPTATLQTRFMVRIPAENNVNLEAKFISIGSDVFHEENKGINAEREDFARIYLETKVWEVVRTLQR